MKQLVVAGVAVVFCAVNTANALHKGGDFLAFLESGRRLLAKAPLYDRAASVHDVTWPPFQAVFFAPLALIAQHHPTLARLVWYGVSVAFLYWALRLWTDATAWSLDVQVPRGPGFLFSHRVVIPIVAMAFPLQTNFEHQNMNPLLLLLTGGAAVALLNGSFTSVGILLGGATALKAFPALLIAYVAWRRFTKPTFIAILTAGFLTLLPVAVYGPDMFATQLSEWFRLSTAGDWPIRGNNQSIAAAVSRFIGPGRTAYIVYLLISSMLLLTFALVAFRRSRAFVSTDAPIELAIATLLAVVISPIAWDHYWVLLFPAFFIVYNAATDERAPAWWLVSFWIAALLTTGLSRPIIGKTGLEWARELSASTAAALLLYGTLLSIWASRQVRK